TFTIPSEHSGKYSLQDGHIRVGSLGSPIGDHRNIDPTVGANPNFTASGREGYYSIFPTITIIDGAESKVDTIALQTAIEEAEQNKDLVKVSVDGKDIDTTENWVTQAELDAYVNIILSAQNLIADETAIQENIDAKVLALNQATEAFNNAKKAGTKAAVQAPTQQAYDTVGKYMVDNLPNPNFGNEWRILTLARGEYKVPASYYDTYYNNVVKHVVSVKGELDQNKYTEYSRLILALTAIGKDPTNVGGYNLIEKLSDFDKVIWQGINGAYYALIALDTKDFELSKTATTTREKLINHILDKQLANNGWALSGDKADPDMTAMALQSLAPYYNSNQKVKAAVDVALTQLATMQLGNGGYASRGTENVESATQVVTALASLGIDANKDPRFNKVISNIMTYYNATDGGFKHTLSDTKSDAMATEQAGYTLAAYNRLLNGQTALYDMSDVKLDPKPEPGEEDLEITVSSDESSFTLKVDSTVADSTPVVLKFDNELPSITADRAGVKLEILSETLVVGDWDKKIQAPTKKETTAQVKERIESALAGKKLKNVTGHIKVGGSKSIEFNQHVSLTFSNLGSNEAGFIDVDGKFTLIPMVNDPKKEVYAYQDGKNLIIKTKHFTEFLTFETEVIETDPPGTGGGGGTTVPSTEKVKLSVEKRTMDGTDIIQAVDVELQSGDTAFTLLKRVVDEKGISIDYSGSGTALYVRAIQGLREFNGGPESGWMYSVNGTFPNYSAGSYILKDGDVLRWQYTKDLGKDIGGYVPDGGEGPTPETQEVTVSPNQPFVLDEKLQGNISTPVILNFGTATTELPQVTAPRGDSVLEISQGTKVTSAWDGKLQVPTNQSTSKSDLEAINKVLKAVGKEIPKVDFRIKAGGDQSIKFDQHVSLTFKGKAGLEAGIIGTDGKFALIGTDPKADVYYYVSGNDLIVKTNHFTEFLLFKSTTQKVELTDIKGHWAEEYIQQAADLGIIKGQMDGTFKPNADLSRAQAASILVRTLGLETEEAVPFKDISGYAEETQAEIAAAYKYGLVIGQAGNFRPKDKVTRSQMALMIYRAYEQKTGKKYVTSQKVTYPDIGNVDKETENAITMLYELGIATGSDGKYMPANATARGQAAKMFVNFFEHIK
ncbi:S-layer homology domain-containing protein, partial [Sporosarcina sp. CAU 1771]